jgi:hypothetical protein
VPSKANQERAQLNPNVVSHARSILRPIIICRHQHEGVVYASLPRIALNALNDGTRVLSGALEYHRLQTLVGELLAQSITQAVIVPVHQEYTFSCLTVRQQLGAK